MSILKFESEEEVVRRANSSAFGLAAGIITGHHQPSEADQIEPGACANPSSGTFENECATRGNGSKQSSI